jgi:hypothetical protein
MSDTSIYANGDEIEKLDILEELDGTGWTLTINQKN